MRQLKDEVPERLEAGRVLAKLVQHLSGLRFDHGRSLAAAGGTVCRRGVSRRRLTAGADGNGGGADDDSRARACSVFVKSRRFSPGVRTDGTALDHHHHEHRERGRQVLDRPECRERSRQRIHRRCEHDQREYHRSGPATQPFPRRRPLKPRFSSRRGSRSSVTPTGVPHSQKPACHLRPPRRSSTTTHRAGSTVCAPL